MVSADDVVTIDVTAPTYVTLADVTALELIDFDDVRFARDKYGIVVRARRDGALAETIRQAIMRRIPRVRFLPSSAAPIGTCETCGDAMRPYRGGMCELCCCAREKVLVLAGTIPVRPAKEAA